MSERGRSVATLGGNPHIVELDAITHSDIAISDFTIMGTRESTLYPKITTHIKDVVKALKNKLRDPDNPEQEPILGSIPIIGTVKLHGTHADIIISPSNKLTFQSRNNATLTESTDNFGFAEAMSSKQSAILHIRDRILSRWKTLNLHSTLDPTLPITIAGEWIGHKIQSHVAVSHLPRRFVIISIRINNQWVPDPPYADIEDPAHDIYNVSRGGTYHATLYPENIQRTIDDLLPLTERIAASCPFASSFGIEGEGEGLVWKLVPYASDASFWFKTKGGRFRPTFAPAPKKAAKGRAERWEVAAEVAGMWCSGERMEQGWDYLREKGVRRDRAGVGVFLKWVQVDILTEEKGYIKEHGVDVDMLKREVIGKAKGWYLERCAKVGE